MENRTQYIMEYISEVMNYQNYCRNDEATIGYILGINVMGLIMGMLVAYKLKLY